MGEVAPMDFGRDGRLDIGVRIRRGVQAFQQKPSQCGTLGRGESERLRLEFGE
jgi:hypothetical protein